MKPGATNGPRARFTFGGAAAIGAVLLCMLLFALVRRHSYDEGQYVAATQLALHGLPYRDFPYLQTPLQPMLFAPIAGLFADHIFLALRAANALCGTAAIVLLWSALRRAGAGERSALAATALFAMCEPFLFGAAVVRNDALPVMLSCAALVSLAGPPGRRAAFVGALAMGAAAAAKISYALPAAALVAMAIGGPKALKRHLPLMPTLAGMAIPALFVAALAAAAPGAFLYEVLIFPVEGPRQWYIANGESALLSWRHPGNFVLFGLFGPALAAVVAVAAAAWRERSVKPATHPRRIVFGGLLAASLIGAYLPNPSFRQYWIPALPPLFLCLGLAFERWPELRSRRMTAVWATFAVAGVATSAVQLGAALWSGSQAVELDRTATRINALMDRAGVIGPVAGLDPDVFAGSRRFLDPRFASGRFLYRTYRQITPHQTRAWHIATFADTDMLANDPPAAIITYRQTKSGTKNERLNSWIEQSAAAAGFRSAGGIDNLRLWLRESDRFQKAVGPLAAQRLGESRAP
ncbi:MAG: DUF2029 domain-containing protein [Sphingomicrobium sp.]